MSTDSYSVQPVNGPVSGAIRPPGSKSITNRALIIAALAEGKSTLTGVLDSVDTRVMVESLRRVGLVIGHDRGNGTIHITGCANKIPKDDAELWLENSGTSIRFLTAMMTLGQGRFRLDGNSRMHERPIIDLVECLNTLGADVSCENGTDCPPVIINASGLHGGVAPIDGAISSQYLSGILMASVGARNPVTLELEGELVSRPYVEMTRGVMARFGVVVDEKDSSRFHVAPQIYKATKYDIEPDASAASYFFGVAAVTGGTVRVEGLSDYALQGDVAFVDALEQMGCEVDRGSDYITVTGGELRGIDIDMNSISDTAQTLAVVAIFADGPTRIRNVGHMRHKETDRIEAVVTELRRMGLKADEHEDGLTIYPGTPQPATIKTYDDHRMAMSFALAGLKAEGIVIADPDCTAKTYPHFWKDLEQLCAGE